MGSELWSPGEAATGYALFPTTAERYSTRFAQLEMGCSNRALSPSWKVEPKKEGIVYDAEPSGRRAPEFP